MASRIEGRGCIALAKKALITGITGQDGAYLSKLLLEKGYEVHGGVRGRSFSSMLRLCELGIADQVIAHDFDLLEVTNLQRVLDTVAPDEVYNLAAQSFVAASFEQPVYTANVDALGPLRLLEALRASGGQARFYQASTSEMFGQVQETPQTERTPFYPRSPYGVAKVFAHWATVNYREGYGMFAVSGILFNHESPLRGSEFVTRKITTGLARVVAGKQEVVELGNLDARRDWGFAGDYVEGMWRMLQADAPDDYVLATGRTVKVREFVERAGEAMGLRIEWTGSGEGERGIDSRSGKTVVAINPRYFRPAEVEVLQGDPSKAQNQLGWRQHVDFPALVAMMAEADARRVRDGDLQF